MCPRKKLQRIMWRFYCSWSNWCLTCRPYTARPRSATTRTLTNVTSAWNQVLCHT